MQHELFPSSRSRPATTAGSSTTSRTPRTWTSTRWPTSRRSRSSGRRHPNLPGGGGEIITLYNLNENKRGVVNNVQTWSTSRHARLQRRRVQLQRAPRAQGLRLRRHHDRAHGDQQLHRPGELEPEQPALLRADAAVPDPLQGVGSYTLPYDIQLGGSFQARPGIPIGADYTVTSAVAGRPLTGGREQHHREPRRPDATLLRLRATPTISRCRASSGSAGRGSAPSWRSSTWSNDSTIYTRERDRSAANAAQQPRYNPIDLVDSRRFQFGFQFDF